MPRNHQALNDKDNKDLIQIQARALADPTRFRIYENLSKSMDGLTVAKINEEFQLNHNAIRQHLAKLLVADLIVKIESKPEGLGRPSLIYKLNQESLFSLTPNNLYKQLALMLLAIISSGESAYKVGFKYGFDMIEKKISKLPNHSLKADTWSSDNFNSEVIDIIARTMKDQGFEPKLMQETNVINFNLERCPLQNAVDENSRVVCELHKGLVQGLASSLTNNKPSKITVKSLIPSKSNRPPCRLSLKVS